MPRAESACRAMLRGVSGPPLGNRNVVLSSGMGEPLADAARGSGAAGTAGKANLIARPRKD